MADRRGFTLVEAAVAVGVVAILAGLMAPMAARVLDQRRKAATREGLRRAFEAMFGSRDRRIANMRADFGFEPPEGEYRNLRFLVARSGPWARVPAFGDHGQRFQWGYNGPYWLGDTRDGVPVDAWGSPIELVCEGGRVQVRSRGPRRERGRAEDDLVYPPEPVPLDGYRSRVLVVVTPSQGAPAGQVSLVHGGNREAHARVDGPFLLTGEATQARTFSAPAGGMEVDFAPLPGPEGKGERPADGKGKGAPPFLERAIPMDLLPGETREVRVTL